MRRTAGSEGNQGVGQAVMGIDIKTVGVIGAGQMGSGIAHVCALAGYDVVIHDVSEDRLKSSLATIQLAWRRAPHSRLRVRGGVRERFR